jgi:hypothetical protein
MVIIEEINNAKKERNKTKIIFEMLKDVKLPEHYYFENDCVEIRHKKFLMGSIKIADIDLEDDILNVKFVDEEELNRLRNYFANSKTKFKLIVDDFYY